MSALANLFAFVFVLGLAPARSPDPAPNPHFEAAAAAWKDERWADAAAAFSRAYDLEPRPEYVFARAQALRFSGECADAIEAYREFIALDPPQGAIDEAREHIATCGGDPAATPEPAPQRDRPSPEPSVAAPSRVPTAAAVPPGASRAPRVERRWWRDPTGHVLGWTGLSAAAVGTGFLIEGLARRERGERAIDEQSYRDARRGGASLLHAGIPLVSLGSALVIGAVIRFVVVARPRGRRAQALVRTRSP